MMVDKASARRVIGATGDQLSGLESFQYDTRGLTNATDALGKITRFVRDTLGRSLYQTNANQEVLGFTYWPARSQRWPGQTEGKRKITGRSYKRVIRSL